MLMKRHEKQITTLTCWPLSKNTKQLHWNIQVRLIFNHISCCSVVLSPDIVVFVQNTYTVESFYTPVLTGGIMVKRRLSVCLSVCPGIVGRTVSSRILQFSTFDQQD